MTTYFSRLATGTSRRLTRGSMAALTVLALTTACSSAVAEQRGGSGSGGSEQTLRIATANDLVPPALFTNTSETIDVLIGAVYDSLVDYPAGSLEPEPRLATDWKVSADGRRVTLDLRDDVTFHSGREFTSKDVEFSIKTWADPTWTVQLQRTAAGVTGFDTTDPHRIVLELAEPMSNVFDLLDMVPIIDSETADQIATGEAFVGTGPFVFESWSPNTELTFSANEDYWDGAPELEGIDVSIISDAQAQVSALRAGQVDVVTGAPPRDLVRLGDSDGYQVVEADGPMSQLYVGADLTNPLLRDPAVRKAVAYAMDRDRIVDEVFQGAGTATSLPWPESSPAYDEKLAGFYDRDVAKASALAKQAGVAQTLPLSYAAGDPASEQTAQILQSNLAEAGIETELKPVEHTEFMKQLIGGTFGGLWLLRHSYAQFTPSTLAVSAYPFNADKNASHFTSADYKAHADGAWNRVSGTDRGAVSLYEELNQDLIDNAFLLEIALLPLQVGAADDVAGLRWSRRGEPVLTDATVGE